MSSSPSQSKHIKKYLQKHKATREKLLCFKGHIQMFPWVQCGSWYMRRTNGSRRQTVNIDQQNNNLEFDTTDDTAMSWDPLKLDSLIKHEQVVLERVGISHSPAHSMRFKPASGDISSQPLESFTAARIIFRVLIYSSSIFEKSGLLRENVIFPLHLHVMEEIEEPGTGIV